MKYTIRIAKYIDPNNENDKGNDCYYLIVCQRPYDTTLAGLDKSFFSGEISRKFKIAFYPMAKKHGGFIDDRDVFFPLKEQAQSCKRELTAVINVTGK